jgi:trans-aconitate methyltransferase
MSVATHLGIDLAEYDARIRTFIPDYEEMLEVAARAIGARTRVLVDLGIGTGALAARCLTSAPQTRIVGIDSDPEILKAAAGRLPASSTFTCNSFLRAEIPPCDAIVASFALHHVRTRAAKAKLYRRLAGALRRGGQVITVDCHPAIDSSLARRQFAGWKAHLLRKYTAKEAENYLKAWSHEDVYMPLDAEMELMSRAGFTVEILWRKQAFAVLRGKKK